MSGSPKQTLTTTTAETTDETETIDEVKSAQELYLRDGRKLVVSETGGEQLVEIRAESGMLELRIRLTEQGPVLQMESVRMTLKATESVAIESERVEIKGTKTVAVEGGQVEIDGKSEEGATGRVFVRGARIDLN